ncbi:MAG: hypothetical protein FWD61_14515 [Phycisphaerales bacterium]|nr:hypothetical protein [Phycisphaerales bacterium]
MDNKDIRKHLHDLSNALNAAKINAYLLRRIHGNLDKEAIDGLDSSLLEGEKIVEKFHRAVYAEMAKQSAAASSTT